MSATISQSMIKKIKELPTLPQVVMQVIKAVDNPDASANEVSRIVSQDQSLMTKVLKLVNSPYYGMPRRIATLSQATVILGFNTIKNLSVTAAIFDQFGGGGQKTNGNGFSRERFWQHSIACGIAAKVIVEHVRTQDPEEAFLAGLIHDIGKVVLDQFMHEEFIRTLELASSNKVSLVQAEYDVLGADHMQVGSWLAEKWNLPGHLIAAIKYHHFPHRAERHPGIAAIVHLADCLVRLEGYGSDGDPLPPEINDAAWLETGLQPDVIPELQKEIAVGYKSAEAFLSIVMNQ